MSVLEIQIPKTVDLVELFELKVWIAMTFDHDIRLPKKQIFIGQPMVSWIANETVVVNGGVLIWKDKPKEYFTIKEDTLELRKGDTVVLSMHWHI